MAVLCLCSLTRLAPRFAARRRSTVPRSQPLRGDILRRALLQAGGKTQAWAVEEDNGSPEMQVRGGDPTVRVEQKSPIPKVVEP